MGGQDKNITLDRWVRRILDIGAGFPININKKNVPSNISVELDFFSVFYLLHAVMEMNFMQIKHLFVM